ncbi:endonuclease [Cellulophaga sp. HaHaR_3_176]|uniref:endonuclease/exonuclease/phosphatase family protein n=1 Tax=Cellulophaga sp. HaHaR_3_176 TaxID=1942464 RepID=UPI001C1F4A94|nr:endonuclease [Cellulophaga sp. HaHaR_3_176]QWX83739.1 endonuclease [Cellulophaga sp. HaHaR_3_176]
MFFSYFKKKSNNSLFTIAFYNLENLFDTIDHPKKLDGDFTPNGKLNWTPQRYKSKLNKLGSTIAKIGFKKAGKTPAIIGVCEVENKTVVKDLIANEALKKAKYSFVHYDSPDERGIGNALIYDDRYFKVISSEPIPLLVYNLDGNQDMTRDILYVHGELNGEKVHVFVNHWPSKRDGGAETEYKRIKASETILNYMSSIEENHASPNYIIMGDFNDGPKSKSIKKLVKSKGLYNPMEKLLTPKRGSANYKFNWMLFDQIIISHSFLNYEKKTHSYDTSNIFDEHFLTEFKGKFKGSPFRTYVGRRYLGGYSDHFPVYLQLKLNK